MKERWKPVPLPGADGYEVSDLGNVRSDKSGEWRPMVTSAGAGGYRQLMLYLRGTGHRNVRLAPLVLEAFIGPRPDGHHASHLNGDLGDNRLANLAWETARANQRRRPSVEGDRNPSARLDPDKVRAIRTKSAAGAKDYVLAVEYGVSPAAIWKIVARKTWAHVA